MSDHEPTPHPSGPTGGTPPTPRTHTHHAAPSEAGAAPVPVGLPVTYELRRGHDGGTISGHCSLACADFAMFAVTSAEAMGTDNPPGPLEWLKIAVHRVADGAEMMWTHVLTPLQFPPPAEDPKPYYQWHGLYS